jgi:putative addiction module component (TIGR02574 family)
MSKAGILQELEKLTSAERQEIVARISDLDAGLTDEERQLLDQELEDFRQNPNDGSPWEEVEARICGGRRP